MLAKATHGASKPAQFRVGTSGYQYDHWRGIFYPRDLPKRLWFNHYATYFDTVEINNTFYRLPGAETFQSWRDHAPQGFLYALKFSRYGTHVKRLLGAQAVIRRFLDPARLLGPALGPILVQLPPHWSCRPDRLQEFLAAAPRRLRWAVEFRDPSWLCDEVYRLLTHHNAALCIHDMIERHPQRVTADFVYLRFHGDHYAGSYSPQRLSAVARRIKTWLRGGIDVYAYFNNDQDACAVHDALALRRYVSGPPKR